MKKILAGILVTVVSLTACKEFLTEEPLSQVSSSAYFKSGKDITAGLAGVYSSFQEVMTGDGEGFSGMYHYWGEGRSDNFDRSQYPNSTITELAINTLTSGNGSANWNNLYRTIARANLMISRVPNVRDYDPNVTAATVNSTLAQCYAIRALCYFYIVRIWGDAPIRTEPYESLAQSGEVPRDPKEKIFTDVIIPDLTKAYDLIPKNQTPVVWNIGEAAIASILGDVYMWRKDHSNAKLWLEKVFVAKGPKGTVHGTSGATLEPQVTWKNLFTSPSTTNESIWSIHWDYTTNGCACIPVSVGRSNNPIRVDSIIHADWKKNKADTRVTKTIDTLEGVGHIDKILKYYPVNSLGSNASINEAYPVYLIMYRLADVYLLYAEVLNATGDKANAIKFLNYSRVRAGLPAITATSPEASSPQNLENAILTERRYELFAEGKRWFDIVRTDKVKEIMDPIINYRIQRLTGQPSTAGFGNDMNKILWPIHRSLLEDNKKLIQNPSYN
ncbi:RagB/SusD family nutrient uptake outer membrane protein [Desertivirga arenae]|uniref:RagB/SusD family nutrient uptake outer membrane protein n=1 Tax=Desertivirga arenae TaxID=2810309 RepID=UPI001A960F30|nr:RagB/SusD family nutrient uptake outer membrane protein [Pedobacter sp. SYSU D00823]